MKLLIIEDDINLASTLARRLTKQGFTCDVAHNQSDALLRARQLVPDSILLDMKLGDDNGLMLIKPLRNLLENTHIVLLTGFASIATAVEAMRLGANDYLTKPIDMATLLKALNNETSELQTSIDDAVMSPERLEWEHIQQVLHSNNGNISVTARQLNMHRRTLQRKLQKKPVQH
ncbi:MULTISPECIES: response regulator [unclassified Pseudoalteromonas]|jgi:two-component system response regulator RegA|uniref:response regulator transcription factor n=1 Tax=Pseudoalteromonas TaxID=53246 RepID=UPI0007310995|nr:MULTISPECIES: response regulator [unclassified Pseudoalteromonas]KTD97075.1 two-component system response regulator [Pseudoalteromonas sp. H71]MBW4965841.1 response regulator [Pseudoalteromonas sp. CR1]MCK8120693.1 response regulator [Pseudoalteromonas sp. 2CM32C]TMN83276.1 DNA-binding response regulator [Pseudoalteromonas sp. S410]TMN89998.1 DNA-binding response regulator [Pseudoalteromonas sp. S408]